MTDLTAQHDQQLDTLELADAPGRPLRLAALRDGEEIMVAEIGPDAALELGRLLIEGATRRMREGNN